MAEELNLLDLIDSAPAEPKANLWDAPGRHAAEDVTQTSQASELDEGDELASLELDESLEDVELPAADGQAVLFDTSELVVEQAVEQHELVYGVDKILEESFKHFRKAGFPVRRLERYQCMQVLNELAKTANSALTTTALGYSIADT